MESFSPALASWTIERAASRLHLAFDGRGAAGTWLAGAIINLESFRSGIRRLTRPAKVEQTVTPGTAIMVQGHGAAAVNSPGEHSANRVAQTVNLLRGKFAGGQSW